MLLEYDNKPLYPSSLFQLEEVYSMVYFSDRKDAGKQLASALTDFSFKEGMVLAIPRGGVVVGYEIASALNFKLDVIVPRKIGTPDNPRISYRRRH